MSQAKYLKIENEDVSIVLLGSFNPAIFNPDWFVRHDLIDDQMATDVNVSSKEVTQIQLGATNLTCMQDKLTLQIGNLAYVERVLDLVGEILRMLPHTPVTAIGVNLNKHYSINDNEMWHRIGHTLAPKEDVWNELGDDPGMKSLEILYTLDSEGARGLMNIQVAPTALNKLSFRVNRHFDIKDDPNVEPKLSVLSKDFLQTQYDAAKTTLDKTIQLIEGKILK